MYLFKTESVKVDDRTSLVYWKSDDKKGIFKVNLMMNSKDVEIISELIAINELIERFKITTGIDKKITISKGAVKKLFLRKIARKELYPYIQFSEVRLLGVVIVVDKKRFLKEDFKEIEVENLHDRWKI